MRIVFMGTPDFAVPCLERLIEDRHRVAAVFSQPDKPRGRGYRLVPTPVKALAETHGIPVYQPAKLKDGAALALLEEIAPELIVVVAYGRILPKSILELPEYGCVNIHASLLPRLRGAAPIQWAVINGDRKTGVTAMHMAEGMDTGDMILQMETEIGESETAGELFRRLSLLGADCLSEAVRLLEAGKAPGIRQEDGKATYAPMIQKNMAFLDYTKSPEELCRLVRGLNPSPCAKTCFEGKLLRVLMARPVSGFRGEPGQILDKKRFIVACGDGAVEFITVQPEGKKAMDAQSFIRGLKGTEADGCWKLGTGNSGNGYTRPKQ